MDLLLEPPAAARLGALQRGLVLTAGRASAVVTAAAAQRADWGQERRPSWYVTATRRDRDPRVAGQDRSGPLDRDGAVVARPHSIKNYQDMSYEAI